jgi:hypothetical protein
MLIPACPSMLVVGGQPQLIELNNILFNNDKGLSVNSESSYFGQIILSVVIDVGPS